MDVYIVRYFYDVSRGEALRYNKLPSEKIVGIQYTTIDSLISSEKNTGYACIWKCVYMCPTDRQRMITYGTNNMITSGDTNLLFYEKITSLRKLSLCPIRNKSDDLRLMWGNSRINESDDHESDDFRFTWLESITNEVISISIKINSFELVMKHMFSSSDLWEQIICTMIGLNEKICTDCIKYILVIMFWLEFNSVILKNPTKSFQSSYFKSDMIDNYLQDTVNKFKIRFGRGYIWN